jgi:hypothetical protein
MFLQSGNICTSMYLPIFFLQKYPEHRTTYAVVNAFVIGSFGILSNLITGMIGDRFEKDSPRIKSRIAIFAALSTIPIMAVELGNHGSYWIS